MFIIRHRNIFFALTGIIVALSLGAVAVFGLQFGIEFTGGSIMEVVYQNERPAKQEVEARLAGLSLGEFSLRPTQSEDGDGFILRTRSLSDDEHGVVFGALSQGGGGEATEVRFNSTGPSISSELRTKALIALVVVALAIVLFVAFVFRKVSKPVASWKYGVIAVVALLHDILIPVGVFAVFGVLFGSEINVLFVIALLTVLGYSVNDTIVVFDRIRENLRRNRERNVKEDFELTVGKSLHQTISRSINTSLTTIAVLLALFFIGGAATQDFALTLIAGIIAGTYSSIFFASPLLVAWERWSAS